MTPSVQTALLRALSESDYFRRSDARFRGVSGHKEWLHFAVHAAGMDVLTNFSIVDDVRPVAPRGAEIARITTLVRGESWGGDIDQYANDEIDVRGGRVALRYADNFVRLVHDALEVKVQMRQRPIALELVLRPLVMPNQANTLYVEGCPGIHWVAVPRLAASGRIEIDGRVHTFSDALAYHDHNWGFWRWGQDFAWEWGYGVPDDAADPWTLIYVRLTDRRHVTDLTQSVFLWRNQRQHRFFRADEIQVEHIGLLRAQHAFKVPRVMGLVSPTQTTDIPERMVVSARGERDWLEFEFKSEDVAQVILPNDDDLGVTVINEVSGTINAVGYVDGQRIAFNSRTIFEFLSD